MKVSQAPLSMPEKFLLLGEKEVKKQGPKRPTRSFWRIGLGVAMLVALGVGGYFIFRPNVCTCANGVAAKDIICDKDDPNCATCVRDGAEICEPNGCDTRAGFYFNITGTELCTCPTVRPGDVLPGGAPTPPSWLDAPCNHYCVCPGGTPADDCTSNREPKCLECDQPGVTVVNEPDGTSYCDYPQCYALGDGTVPHRVECKGHAATCTFQGYDKRVKPLSFTDETSCTNGNGKWESVKGCTLTMDNYDPDDGTVIPSGTFVPNMFGWTYSDKTESHKIRWCYDGTSVPPDTTVVYIGEEGEGYACAEPFCKECPDGTTMFDGHCWEPAAFTTPSYCDLSVPGHYDGVSPSYSFLIFNSDVVGHLTVSDDPLMSKHRCLLCSDRTCLKNPDDGTWSRAEDSMTCRFDYSWDFPSAEHRLIRDDYFVEMIGEEARCGWFKNGEECGESQHCNKCDPGTASSPEKCLDCNTPAWSKSSEHCDCLLYTSPSPRDS